MKIINLCILFFISSQSVLASPYWIVGDDYLGYSKDGKELELKQKIAPSSWGFEAKSCRLWTSDDVSHERILSDVDFTRFFTLSSDFKLNVRDASGSILSSTEAPWATTILRILPGLNGTTWSLHQDLKAKMLWIEGRNAEWALIKKIPVSSGNDLWGQSRLRVDLARKRLWIGYARTTVQHVYQTFVQAYDFEGSLKKEQTWDNKGLFFDSCIDEDGNLLASRDVPSAGFTVPVHSYLEKVPLVGKSTTLLALETNDFMDTLLCQPESINYIARSIFTSDKPRLFRWNPKAGTPPEKLLELPSKASQLYDCHVE